ncbi:CRAL/TRIO domain-containing protein [Crepidotus variabilis]|uniref:CRAL/TRIO domain-containing protein n=1 Tax=Crepidotus variabilis TaxID=179855 RepID=A0A9P6EUE5_9AGAR|nr:CRAL/TRIO domain-containing protein [Crepidotus variabilis]
MSPSPISKTTNLLLSPAPDTIIKPIYDYTDNQRAMLDELREYALSISLPESDPYHPWELRWLNKSDTIPRYMRAAKWIVADGKKRIQATLEWRREFKPDLIPPEEVKIESETGKIIINGFDKDGRPIIYMRPGRENTETSPRQLRHLVWCLERAKDLMPPGQESLVIIVDYKSTTLKTNPPISVARKVLTILQQHYCETLGRAIVTNLPMLLSFFYKGISPFLDPVTRDKMRFNPDLLELIPASQLDAEFGGDNHFEFNSEKYWDQIVAACGVATDGTRVESSSASDDETVDGRNSPHSSATASVDETYHSNPDKTDVTVNVEPATHASHTEIAGH